ncbi:putative phosphoglycerate mutase pmu1 [Ascochyta rabiei]|uniref:Uncharacterized protein n=1 Tax=Didymella rabiei TaxID=5454 RepID=A0A163KZG3_DIDRA|nr:putative phosphoglycerate mutase pmu1 [Ascochyta rabiei]KZM27373.1 hypothetical protein ST47_g1482 [Ascochyta rabiei]UPX20233.1 putative phosphoglycerate mutase pmu1 [Ascochyta rabiei]
MPSSTSDDVPVPGSAARDYHFRYTVQKGIFLQSEESTDDAEFDFKKQHFGLIPRTYPSASPSTSTSTSTSPSTPATPATEETQWRRFTSHLHSLLSTAAPDEHFKLVFLARHGEGWHNVAEAKYGTSAWDQQYACLDGADGLTWADAHLTPTGQQQALAVHDLWADELPRGIPAPETFYVSPLTRTLQTADRSFANLSLPHPRRYVPRVHEGLREALGVHTCDRRSSRSDIAIAFPHAVFEDGFADEDGLWEAEHREPRAARRYRLASFLDHVVASDDGVVWSFTSHSGAIASLLEAVGHRAFRLETGGVIPVLLKAERVEGKRKAPPKEPSEAPPMCHGLLDAHVSGV